MAAFAASFLCSSSSTPSLKTPLRHSLVSFPASRGLRKPCSVNLKPLICASSSDGIKPLEQQQDDDDDDDDDSRSKVSYSLHLLNWIVNVCYVFV